MSFSAATERALAAILAELQRDYLATLCAPLPWPSRRRPKLKTLVGDLVRRTINFSGRNSYSGAPASARSYILQVPGGARLRLTGANASAAAVLTYVAPGSFISVSGYLHGKTGIAALDVCRRTPRK
jgi:hypothetical protein